VGNASALFDEQGNLDKAETRDFMQKFLQSFARWIERNAGK